MLNISILQGLLTRTIFWHLACWYANISSWNVKMFWVSFFPFNSGGKWAFIISQILHSKSGAPDWSTSVHLPLPPPSNMWPVRRLQTLLLVDDVGSQALDRTPGSTSGPEVDPRLFILFYVPLFCLFLSFCADRLMRVHNRPERLVREP